MQTRWLLLVGLTALQGSGVRGAAAVPASGAGSGGGGGYSGAVGELVGLSKASLLEDVATACAFPSDGRRLDDAEVGACIGAALQVIGPVQGLGSLVGSTNDTRVVCTASAQGSKTVKWGCETLWALSWEVLAKGLACVAICRAAEVAGDPDACGLVTRQTLGVVRRRMELEVERHARSPLQDIVGRKVASLLGDFDLALRQAFSPAALWDQVVNVAQTLAEWVRWYTWRENHFAWLMDILSTGEISRSTEWGTAEHWDKVGANDARAAHVLDVFGRPPPAYVFSELYGMRWDIMISLLRRLHADLGSPSELLVVELGVFAGHFSKFLLDALPFVKLVGVDPYIGRDGTFPGDYSETIDPDIALAQAADTFRSYGDARALLMDMTSTEAAERVPLRSVDAVFVDGCHLYECVDADIRAWLPRLRGPGSLLVGHDYSPQWPGVVRAVHEHRGPGGQVFLGMDWMWWWYLD